MLVIELMMNTSVKVELKSGGGAQPSVCLVRPSEPRSSPLLQHIINNINL